MKKRKLYCTSNYSSPTSFPYKGRRIKLLSDGSGWAIFDTDGELWDSGFRTKQAACRAIDEYDNIYQPVQADTDDIEREFDRIDRSGTDEEVEVAAVMYNLGTTMKEAREILPTLSEDKIKDYVDYYYLRDLPAPTRLKLWNSRKTISSSSTVVAGTKSVYIDHYNAFDNGKVLRNFQHMTEEQAQEAARQASIKDPTDAYYVHYDDVMNPGGDIVWVNGVAYRGMDVSPRGEGVAIRKGAQPVEVATASTEIKAHDFPESEDGWGTDVRGILDLPFARAEDLMYEIRNTIRGAYTDCETVEDLADYIRQLASEFEEAADELESL